MDEFYNLVRTAAENATIWDNHGREYIDFSSGGAFCAILGINNRTIIERLVKEIISGPGMNCYRFKTEVQEAYIEALCKFTGFEHAVMFSSGTEATEAAWKVMRLYKQKEGILGLDGAFHGKTLGALIAAGKMPDYRYGNPEAAAGIIMEPYKPLTAKFHSQKEINHYNQVIADFDIMLAIDEIQGGFYRTGKLFGYHHYTAFDEKEQLSSDEIRYRLDNPKTFSIQPLIKPDLVCIGKAAFNGFPASALLGPAWMDDPRFDLSSTHGGNPMACAVGLAVLEYIEENDIAAESRNKGTILGDSLSMMLGGDLEYNHTGMVAGLVFGNKAEADKVVLDCKARGLLLIPTGANTVKVAPALTIPDGQLHDGLMILAEVLNDLET